MILAVKNNIDTNRQFPSLNIEQNLDWRSRNFQATVSSKILVIIDSKVTNPRILAAGVISGAEVKILDPHRDGITQITEILQATSSIHSLHIVAHGSPGCLYLGNSQLSLDTLADYSATIKTWSLPSILLYGCNVAQGDVGAKFLSKLQQLTKAQIQASTTKVGNFNQGRNWKLDIAVGGGLKLTNTEIAFNQVTQNSYDGSFSNDDPFPAELNLSDLDGTNGFVVNGSDGSVDSAGDFNGDGINDIITSGSSAEPNTSYVIFGESGIGSSGSIELSDLNSSNSILLDGLNDFFLDTGDINSLNGFLRDTGDVNGDGFDDLLLGAPLADPNGRSDAGQTYVIFGTNHIDASGTIDLSQLDGNNGFALNGINEGDRAGAISNAGDVNGDGIEDIIIGAPRADANGNDRAGQSYVVFGDDHVGSSGVIELSDLDGNNGFALNGIGAVNYAGNVSNAGDVNGDGIDDLIIGAPLASALSYDLGQAYIVFGDDHVGSSGVIELSDLDGSNGFAINGDSYFGSSISDIGDVNGDGIDDIFVGAPGSSRIPSGAEGYVIFGGNNVGSSGTLNISDLDGSNGFVVSSGNLNIFDRVRGGSNAGDINQDGIQDLIIRATSNFVDSSYILFGNSNIGSSGIFELPNINGSNGFVFSDSGNATNGGDINQDGIDDLIVNIFETGQSYVVFGRDVGSNIRIEAEDYVDYHDRSSGNIGGAYRNDDVDIELSQDLDNGFSVGWIQQGEWLTYDIDVPEDGFYQVVGRVASDLNRDHRLDVSLDGQTTELKFGDTGGWYSWENVAGGGLNLTAGHHSLRLDAGSSGFNVNYVDLVPTNNIRVEAEDYVNYHDRSPGNIGGAYRNDDVDIELSQDFDNGFSVGWIQQGEWLTYDIDVPEDGVYQVVGRVASDLDRAHRLDVSLDGQTTQLSFGDTGGWYSWEDVVGDGLHLSAGHHSLRLDVGSSGFNVNYIDLISDA